MTKGWSWIVCVGVCLLGGGLSGLSVVSAMREWYPTVIKPDWTPPNHVFGPVWSALYMCMGTSVWLALRRLGGTWKNGPIGWFALQLALNWAWTPLFFGLHWIGGALIEIILLWLAIAATIKSFLPLSRPAAYLLIPYLGWVSAATALTYSIWRLNP